MTQNEMHAFARTLLYFSSFYMSFYMCDCFVFKNSQIFTQNLFQFVDKHIWYVEFNYWEYYTAYKIFHASLSVYFSKCLTQETVAFFMCYYMQDIRNHFKGQYFFLNMLHIQQIYTKILFISYTTIFISHTQKKILKKMLIIK